MPAINEVHNAEALRALAALPDACVDMLLTDPPYSSGGMFRGDRLEQPDEKYARGNEQFRSWTGFAGDNRDQRSWGYWCALWLGEALRCTRPGGFGALFCDWRQIAMATDALQAGGWVYRGIVPWDKTEGARPQLGRPRNQCEYVVWGTNGPAPNEGEAHPGCIRVAVRKDDKHHLTGKPTEVMRQLARLAPAGGVVLDPFAGSGTTVVGAILEGRRGLGFEIREDHAATARARIAAVLAGIGTAPVADRQVPLFEAAP